MLKQYNTQWPKLMLKLCQNFYILGGIKAFANNDANVLKWCLNRRITTHRRKWRYCCKRVFRKTNFNIWSKFSWPNTKNQGSNIPKSECKTQKEWLRKDRVCKSRYHQSSYIFVHKIWQINRFSVCLNVSFISLWVWHFLMVQRETHQKASYFMRSYQIFLIKVSQGLLLIKQDVHMLSIW